MRHALIYFFCLFRQTESSDKLAKRIYLIWERTWSHSASSTSIFSCSLINWRQVSSRGMVRQHATWTVSAASSDLTVLHTLTNSRGRGRGNGFVAVGLSNGFPLVSFWAEKPKHSLSLITSAGDKRGQRERENCQGGQKKSRLGRDGGAGGRGGLKLHRLLFDTLAILDFKLLLYIEHCAFSRLMLRQIQLPEQHSDDLFLFWTTFYTADANWSALGDNRQSQEFK